MLRKLLIIPLSVCALCIPAGAETFSVGNLNFEITGKNTCRLTASPGASGTLALPSTLTYENADYTLTSISGSALANATGLEALLVPGTVTEIGDGAARGCTALRIVELGDGLTTLGAEAFVGCSALESVVLPDNLKAIPRRCFYNASALRQVRIGAATGSIGTQAFDGCSALSSVVCMAPVPPSTAAYAFDTDAIGNALLTVPSGCRPAYAAEPVWRDFRSIAENDHGGAEAAFTAVLPDGTVTSSEAIGSRITLSIKALEGWTIQALHFNGTDATSEISPSGQYTTPPITEDSFLSVVLRDLSGTDSVLDPDLLIRRTGREISVEGVPSDAAVDIYSLHGRIICRSHGSGRFPTDHTMPVLVITMGHKFIL